MLSANGDRCTCPELIAELFGGSRSEARRKLAQGGVQARRRAAAGRAARRPGRALDGRVLQVGKRQFRRLRAAARPRHCAPAAAGATRPQRRTVLGGRWIAAAHEPGALPLARGVQPSRRMR